MLDIVTAKEKKGSNADAVEVDDMEEAVPKPTEAALKRKLFTSFMPKRPPSTGPSKVLDELEAYLNESVVEHLDPLWTSNIGKEMLIGSNSCLVLPYTCSVFQHLQPTLKGFLVWRKTF